MSDTDLIDGLLRANSELDDPSILYAAVDRLKEYQALVAKKDWALYETGRCINNWKENLRIIREAIEAQ